MRLVLAVMLALSSFPLNAQTVYPMPQPYVPGVPSGGQWQQQPTPQGAAQQAYGGCYGCSYMGDYRPSPGPRRPAPPLRLQGQWRNGWWYY
jgi:hypothetical protein